MKLDIDLKENSYPVYIEHGLLDRLNSLLPEGRRYVILADSGIPEIWIDKVKKSVPEAEVLRFPQGEASKSFEQFERLMRKLADLRLSRKDALIALGGGVTGDLTGFLAACYMRGIDYYQIPTTVLSQVDSSVGGKTAIDVGTMKNLCGAFWQPKGVFIDPDVLQTLDDRQISAGLVEALKMGLILDPELVDLFEQETLDTDEIITRSIALKADVVSKDEKEGGLRKILNFGHTIGHAIEAAYDSHDYLHGECVGMGMYFFIEDPELKERVHAIEKRLNIPEIPDFDRDLVYQMMTHDKKGSKNSVDAIFVDAPGKYRIQTVPYEVLKKKLEDRPV